MAKAVAVSPVPTVPEVVLTLTWDEAQALRAIVGAIGMSINSSELVFSPNGKLYTLQGGAKTARARIALKMTKQHFEAFAHEIANSWATTERKTYAARTFATVAKQFNPRFDTNKFYLACGLDMLVGC